MSTEVIRGYAIVFNRLSEHFGFFREQIAPEAVARTLKDRVDLRALVDHDPVRILGRLTAGTLRAEQDGHGLLVEIDPPETTSGQDIVESIRRRDVTGMSFAFRTLKDLWDELTDPPTRTVRDMLVREVSIVSFPSYPQTEVALRSLGAHRSGYHPGRDDTDTARIQEGRKMEMAMAKHPDGTPVARLEARVSFDQFRRALRSAGGRAPRGKIWCSQTGWVDRPAPRAAGGLSLADAQRKQDQVTRQIASDAGAPSDEAMTPLEQRLHARRRAHLERERAATAQREADAVRMYAEASEDSLAWLKRYSLGWAGSPHPSLSECVGKTLSISFPRGASLTAQCARKARLAQ